MDTNVILLNCNTSLMTMVVKSLRTNIDPAYDMNVNAKNSIFGIWTFQDVLSIDITNCSTINNDFRQWNETLLSFRNSNVWMKSIFITFRAQHKIIDIFGSNATIESSHFAENYVRFGTLLYISDASVVNIIDSHFSENVGKIAGTTFVTDSRLRVTNCYFGNNTAFDLGGGISAFREASVTIFNSSFVENTAQNSGGALYGELYVVIAIINATFLRNKATGPNSTLRYYGGAINCHMHCVLSCLHCDFTENASGFEGYMKFYLNESVSSGGAVSLYNNSIFYLVSSRFYRNMASTDGGGIVVANSSSMAASKVEFENNEALVGGAIYEYGNSTIAIEKSRFHNNSARSHSGVVMVMENSEINITETVFTSNTVFYSVGCIFVIFNSSAIISDSLFDGNDGGYYVGGAISICENSTLLVTNGTFVRNSAGVDGGSAIAVETSTNVTIDDSYFSDNKMANIRIVRNSSVSITNCDISGSRGAGLGGAIQADGNATVRVAFTTIRNNMAFSGGGLYARYSDLHLDHCSLVNNSASEIGGTIHAIFDSTVSIRKSNFKSSTSKRGGAIAATGNTRVNISDSTFTGNHANDSGGALAILGNSKLQLQASVFSGNTASVKGGAIYSPPESVLNISQCTFENNSAMNIGGGAIFLNGAARLNLTNSIFARNQATGVIGGAGAIGALHGAIAYLKNVTFVKNKATLTGGALDVSESSYVNIFNCSFHNNEVKVYHGGAIIVQEDSLLIAHHSTFTNNKMQNQGCIFISQSTAFIQTCTFINNTVTGPYVSSAGGAILTLNSKTNIAKSLFSGNKADRGNDVCVFQSIVHIYKSFFVTKHNILHSYDESFREKALKENTVEIKGFYSLIQETPYA